jgi:hypothetical protein
VEIMGVARRIIKYNFFHLGRRTLFVGHVQTTPCTFLLVEKQETQKFYLLANTLGRN